jgi:hypothetical protein
MRGIDPTSQTSSTPPFGALRCKKAVERGETVWIHVHVTYGASDDVGRRSWTAWIARSWVAGIGSFNWGAG